MSILLDFTEFIVLCHSSDLAAELPLADIRRLQHIATRINEIISEIAGFHRYPRIRLDRH
jgi:hypothetical protein